MGTSGGVSKALVLVSVTTLFSEDGSLVHHPVCFCVGFYIGLTVSSSSATVLPAHDQYCVNFRNLMMGKNEQ